MNRDKPSPKKEIKVPSWIADTDLFQKALRGENKEKPIVEEIIVDTPIPTDLQQYGLENTGMSIPSMLEAGPNTQKMTRTTRIEVKTRDPVETIKQIVKDRGYIHLGGFEKDRSGGQNPSSLTFRLEKELGSGGFGIVVKGHGDDIFTKNVAIKISRPQEDPKQEYVARKLFQKEITGARDFEDKSFAYLWGAGIIEETQTTGLVSEFIEGETLEAKLAKWKKAGKMIHPLPASFIFWRKLGGEDSMNKQGFAHRDHKPANTMISKLGPVKILDLGGIKSTDSNGNGTLDIILGTPPYLHPGVYNAGQGDRVNYAKADFHAMCLEMYEMLTGINPLGTHITKYFDNEGKLVPNAPQEKDFNLFNYYIVKDAVMKKYDIAPPHKINRLVPEFLGNLVMQGLKYNLDEIPTASQVKDKLQHEYIHCSWYGGIGAQDITLKDYFETLDPEKNYDPKESVKNRVSLKPVALANLYQEAIALYNHERDTMMMQKGKLMEVAKHDIETDPRLKHKIDYTLGGIDHTFEEAIGKEATRILARDYRYELEDFDEDWDAYYNHMKENIFAPKIKAKYTSASEKEISRLTDRSMQETFWRSYIKQGLMYRPKQKTK